MYKCYRVRTQNQWDWLMQWFEKQDNNIRWGITKKNPTELNLYGTNEEDTVVDVSEQGELRYASLGYYQEKNITYFIEVSDLMDANENKTPLDDLVVAVKGRNTMFVDKELYEELQELPEDSLNRVYSALECDHTNKYKHVWWWLTCNDSRRNDRAHERMLLDYLDGELEIKPHPDEKYKVYWSVGEDQDGDTWYTGLEKDYVLGFETHCLDEEDDAEDAFTSIAEDEINKFQSDTGITLPKSAWHKVTGEKESYE